MGLHYTKLNNEVRRAMVEEIESDAKRRNVYYRPRLNSTGHSQWISLLIDAAEGGDDDWLANTLVERKLLVPSFSAAKNSKKPGFSAAETLAEGEFNRYYIRAVCKVALEKNIDYVTVYRAKKAWAPRPESMQLDGRRFDPEDLLNDLRTNVGRATRYGVPAGPNSGMSVEY